METHLRLDRPVSTDVYERLHQLEDRILLMESLSPEYISTLAPLVDKHRTAKYRGTGVSNPRTDDCVSAAVDSSANVSNVAAIEERIKNLKSIIKSKGDSSKLIENN